MDTPQDTIKCYEVLGVEPGAAAERIRKAYLDLAHQWDPERYVDNPTLRAETAKKRKEIDDAYQAIRFFLPELQNIHEEGPGARVTRDFRELAVEPKQEISKAVLGVICALVLAGVIYLAFMLFRYGKTVTPASQAVPINAEEPTPTSDPLPPADGSTPVPAAPVQDPAPR